MSLATLLFTLVSSVELLEVQWLPWMVSGLDTKLACQELLLHGGPDFLVALLNSRAFAVR